MPESTVECVTVTVLLIVNYMEFGEIAIDSIISTFLNESFKRNRRVSHFLIAQINQIVHI